MLSVQKCWNIMSATCVYVPLVLRLMTSLYGLACTGQFKSWSSVVCEWLQHVQGITNLILNANLDTDKTRRLGWSSLLHCACGQRTRSSHVPVNGRTLVLVHDFPEMSKLPTCYRCITAHKAHMDAERERKAVRRGHHAKAPT